MTPMELLTRPPPPDTVAMFNDDNTAIVVDDGCYCIRNWNGKKWGWSSHIFGEALKELKTLPEDTREAKRLLDV